MKGFWKDEEVKSLFDEVEKVKKDAKPIKEAFENHAKNFKRKPNSVRNYYYHEIENLKKNKERAKALNINISKHKKNNRVLFSQEEKAEVIEKIKSLVNKGCSVRKACLMLSNGNVSTMLRYQNKYRTTVENKPDNVLKFKNRPSHITESDLHGLFMGLVKLIKRNAIEEFKMQFEKENEKINNEMRKMITLMGQKDRELNFLRQDNARLKTENLKLKKKEMQSLCAKAGEMTSAKA